MELKKCTFGYLIDSLFANGLHNERIICSLCSSTERCSVRLFNKCPSIRLVLTPTFSECSLNGYMYACPTKTTGYVRKSH